jgi:hypothetical protein
MDASTSEGLPGYGRSGTIRWLAESCLLKLSGAVANEKVAGSNPVARKTA